MRFDLKVWGKSYPEVTTCFRSVDALKSHFKEYYAELYDLKPKQFKRIFERMNKGCSSYLWANNALIMFKVEK